MTVARDLPAACSAAHESIHEQLDGERLAAERSSGLARHLAVCAECRRFQRQLQAIQRELGAMSAAEFPETALHRLWRRTVRPVPQRRGPAYVARAVLAVAAVSVVAVLVAVVLREPASRPEPELTRVEAERAARETRIVLGMAARALERSERAAVERVLAGEVSPALRQVPLEWPSPPRRTES